MSSARPAAFSSAQQAAANAARDSYGRLLSSLAYRWRDIAAAEDALAEAFAAALEHWPRDGVPRNPDAWLMTAAKRHLLQVVRHQKVTLDPSITILLERDEAEPEPFAVADERLRLLFVCAHPAIDSEIRTALMLQTVLGLDAKQIAAAFLVRPSTLAQRLVRAKAKIKATGLRFELPQAHDLPQRSRAVLEAVYAAYGVGWQHLQGSLEGAIQPGADLASEAIFLAGLCAAQLPDDPEAAGLLALMLYCEARRPASVGADGSFIPLHRQDTSLWDRTLLHQAELSLRRAADYQRPGIFQIEAAIQSAHCHRLIDGDVPWAGITRLYELLLTMEPSVGAVVGHAVAISESGDPAAGLKRLRAIDPTIVITYQPYWVALAHLSTMIGDKKQARDAYRLAIGLTEQPAIRLYLQRQMGNVGA